MSTVSIENLSPELLQMIASFLSPSDVVKLSLVTKKAAFLLPDYDQIQINNNEMIRAENYKTTLLDIEVSAEVNEVMITFNRENKMPICNNFQPVVVNTVDSTHTISIFVMFPTISFSIKVLTRTVIPFISPSVVQTCTFATYIRR